MFAVARPHTADRPATVTAASASLGLLAVLAIPTMILASDGVDPRSFGLGATFAALKLIAAFGLWRCRRWGALLGFFATLFDALLALTGFGDGTSGDGAALVAIGVVIGVATLRLIVLPSSRRAYA